MLRWWRARRRRRVLARGRFDAAAFAAALTHVRPAARLPEADRERLRDLVTLFVHEKEFVGAHGFVVTDAMRDVIAVQACLLVLELGFDVYDGWQTVVVYPDQFRTREVSEDEIGIVTIDDEARAGEAWPEGPVVLSWADVLEGVDAGAAGEAYNLVVHEFAHKLDIRSGATDGMPPLHADMDPAEWRREFSAAFADLGARVDDGEETRLDPYAATDPAEFFAVTSEAFFETPHDLLADYPAVYEQLRRYYRQDPAALAGGAS